MTEWTTNPMNAITAAMALIVIILIIWISVLGRRLKHLRSKYTDVMGQSGVTNLEDVIIQLRNTISAQHNELNMFKAQLNDVQHKMNKQKAKMGMLRYNAFAETGSDQSFSIAIVDEEKDGAVITSIHTRQASHVYAKPLIRGQSKYPLTPEEKKAILDAD